MSSAPTIADIARTAGVGTATVDRVLNRRPGVNAETQRAGLDTLRDLNANHLKQTGNLEIASRIAAYELAFRMQTSAPELLDFSKEHSGVLDDYGVAGSRRSCGRRVTPPNRDVDVRQAA